MMSEPKHDRTGFSEWMRSEWEVDNILTEAAGTARFTVTDRTWRSK